MSGRTLRRRLSESSYAAGPTLIFVALFVANAAWQHSFLDPSNWATTLALASPFVLTALAQTLPVMTGNGGLDLSVGPFAGFSAVMAAGVLGPAGVTAPELVLPIILGLGLAAGAFTGFLIAYIRLPPIIATLGAYLFYAGIAAQIMPTPGGTVPGWLTKLAGSFGPIPGTLIVFGAVAVGWILLSRTAYLRNLLMLGGDDRAAHASGVNIAVVRLIAYALAGLLSALAGLLIAGSLQSADATVGPTFTISSIAAVALGGIGLGGGRGGLLGAAIGGGCFYLIQNLLTVASVSVFQLDIADGLLLIAALALSARIEFFRRRRGMRAVARLQALVDEPTAAG